MAKVGYIMNYAGYGADTDKEWMKRLAVQKLQRNGKNADCVRNGTNCLTGCTRGMNWSFPIESYRP